MLQLPPLKCRRLIRVVTARLRDLDGVQLVRVDGNTGRVYVQGAVSNEDMRNALADEGFPVELLRVREHQPAEAPVAEIPLLNDDAPPAQAGEEPGRRR